ncbi:coiled-coil domain-containing protein 112-like [Lingula anatina]|uniref:Coiled-coil domain-containing protein 112-like n=1 Tax=Lingula anatina TaxID=7574 RepID=A0A1S3JIQ9_LINAN|nr:coiled-coil domain-containing protein 112-like [Lingula anatina]|eukprot:XP_013410258.1 coiled-coil domain-containing protein 112-like [Lingula anatina]
MAASTGAEVRNGLDSDRSPHSSRGKGDHSKKMELIKEILQLNTKIKNMEREKSTHLYSKRSDFRKDFSNLEDADMKFTNEHASEKVKLKQQLNKIRSMVKKFHHELQDVKPTPEFVEKLKIIMEDIEKTISAFKEEQRIHYEELMREEKATTQEIQALEKRFEAWSQAGPVNLDTPRSARPKPLASARDVTKDLPPEVAAFERFLQQTGGHRGGWDEYDHQTFMKFRNKHKGKPLFIRELYPALPTKTEQQVREHENWYQEYSSLNEKKKDAIQSWRIKKEHEKKEVLAQAEEESESEEDERMLKLQEKIEKEKEDRFKKLNAWKVQKELERVQEEERKLREDLSKKAEEDREKERQEKLRAMVQEYKQQKNEVDDFLKLEEMAEREAEAEAKRKQLAKELPRLKQRNQKFLEEKLAREKAKEEADKKKKERLERIKSQVKVDVKRDPSRLLKPTAGWMEREKNKGPNGGGQVLSMQHRYSLIMFFT